MKNQAHVGKEFGNLADLRASDPVTIAKAARAYKQRRNTDQETMAER